MTEPIPKTVLDANHLRLCRQVAAALINAMAERGMSFGSLDATVEAEAGWSRRLVDRLIDGNNSAGLRELADWCCAAGVEIEVKVRSREIYG